MGFDLLTVRSSGGLREINADNLIGPLSETQNCEKVCD
jgi:hypothetical protein